VNTSVPADLRLPSIDGVLAFEAVLRLGSFERAAAELHVTASAVSKRIAALEDLLGTPLLQRGSRAVAPTVVGKEYLEQVRPALHLLGQVPLHRRAEQRAQRLRVTVPPTFARLILVPALPQLEQQLPGVEVEVVLSIPFLDISAGEADVEVHFAKDAIDAPLMSDVVLPLASARLLDRHPALNQPSDLARLPLIRTPPEPWTPWFQAAGLDWSEPTRGAKLVDLGMSLDAALCGHGVVLGRPSLASRWLASGELVAPFRIAATPAYQYRVVRNADFAPAVTFAAWLAEVCERARAQGLERLAARG
jgi:DNA-binding transcriptional LysR family regulator